MVNPLFLPPSKLRSVKNSLADSFSDSSQIFRAAGDSHRRSNLNAVVDIFAYSRE